MIRELKNVMRDEGWAFHRQGKGSHEIWRSPDGRQMPVPVRASDTGHRRKNYLRKIKTRIQPRPKTQEECMLLDQLAAGDKFIPGYDQETPWNGRLSYDEKFHIIVSGILKGGGKVLGTLRRDNKYSASEIVKAMGPSWNKDRLRTLESSSGLPIPMTADDFLTCSPRLKSGDSLSAYDAPYGEQSSLTHNATGVENPTLSHEPSDCKPAPYTPMAKAMGFTAQLLPALLVMDAPTKEELIEFRLSMGLNQTDMAKKLGIGRGIYKSLELGRRGFSKSDLRRWHQLKKAWDGMTPSPSVDTEGLTIILQPETDPQPQTPEVHMTAPSEPAFLPMPSDMEEPLPPPPPACGRQATINRALKLLASKRLTDAEAVSLVDRLQDSFLTLMTEDLS